MTLTPNQSLMLEAACEEVLNAGKLHRQRSSQPLATEGSRIDAALRYELAVEYLGKLLRKLEATNAKG